MKMENKISLWTTQTLVKISLCVYRCTCTVWHTVRTVVFFPSRVVWNDVRARLSVQQHRLYSSPWHHGGWWVCVYYVLKTCMCLNMWLSVCVWTLVSDSYELMNGIPVSLQTEMDGGRPCEWKRCREIDNCSQIVVKREKLKESLFKI